MFSNDRYSRTPTKRWMRAVLFWLLLFALIVEVRNSMHKKRVSFRNSADKAYTQIFILVASSQSGCGPLSKRRAESCSLLVDFS